MKTVYITLIAALMIVSCGEKAEDKETTGSSAETEKGTEINTGKMEEMKNVMETFVSKISDSTLKAGVTPMEDVKQYFGNIPDMNDDAYDSYKFIIDGGSIKLQASFSSSNDTLSDAKIEVVYDDQSAAQSFQPKIHKMITKTLNSEGENVGDDKFWYRWEIGNTHLEFCDASFETGSSKKTKYDIRYNNN